MIKPSVGGFAASFISATLPFLVHAETWIQIEAHPTAIQAISRAETLDDGLDDISVFTLRSGWFALALGPFSDASAPDLLRQLRSSRQIPSDSFLATPSDLGSQIWLGATSSALNDQPAEETAAAPTPVAASDETPAEARRAERQLSREEREYLQEALQWAGFYRSGIDGAFGPGTRRAMGDWQAANGYEATGVMTTAQRQDLITGYEDFMASLGMKYLYEQKAGIEIDLPMTMLEFDRYDPPFAVFRGKDDPDLQVMLISQEGDRSSLTGLYEAMQTLKIVPLDGSRKLNRSSFRIEGTSEKITSRTFAQLSDGQIKGFSLVWPNGDEERRDYIFKAMSDSFRSDNAYVLPDFVEGQSASSIDLLAGLEIRKPEISSSGFFVDSRGTIVTTTQSVDGCDAITLEDDRSAKILAENTDLGIAVLRPNEETAPVGWANFSGQNVSIGDSVALSGYSFGGRLDAPSVTFGTLEENTDLEGNADRIRITMAAYEGDIGGPVMNEAGQVIGVLLGHDANGRKLPDNVHFAASASAVVALLVDQGVNLQLSEGGQPQDTLSMEALSADMTVNIACWK